MVQFAVCMYMAGQRKGVPGSSRCRGCSVSLVGSGLVMNPRGPTTARATGLPSRLVTPSNMNCWLQKNSRCCSGIWLRMNL